MAGSCEFAPATSTSRRRTGQTYRARLVGEDVLGNRTVVVVLWTGEPRVVQLYDHEIIEFIVLRADDTSRFDRVLGGLV